MYGLLIYIHYYRVSYRISFWGEISGGPIEGPKLSRVAFDEILDVFKENSRRIDL